MKTPLTPIESQILANLRANRPAFDGLSAEQRRDYAETVRIENDVRAERAQTAETTAPHTKPAIVPHVGVWYEDGIRLSRELRVF